MPLRHPLFVRLLHVGFVAGAAMQLFTSEFMKMPRPGRTLSAWQSGNFLVHDRVGTALLVTVALYLVARAFFGKPRGLAHFFPWGSATGRSALARELGAVARLQPQASQRLFTAARAVQGAGLALMIFMGSTGFLLGQAVDAGGTLSPAMRLVKEAHEAGGSLLWAFLAAHVAIALPHLLARRFAILDIFRFRAPRTEGPAAP